MADEPLPRGFMLQGNTFVRSCTIDVDAVVIGTGAGGAMMLRQLARAGIDAIAIEEGADRVARDMTQREDEMLASLFQERAGRTTDDLAISVLQGRGVGGSTIHNTNLCKRAPDEILDLWARRHGVSNAGKKELDPRFEEVERDLSVSMIPDASINANNDVLRRGIASLGWRGGKLAHNRVGCVGSGFCELGCAYDAKQNARKVLVPQALEAGARVLCRTRARRIVHDGRRVFGVEAVSDGGAQILLRCKIVVLAASAIGSAALAIASRVPDESGQQGQSLHLHPGAAVAGEMPDQPGISGWRGIPQSWECTEHLDFGEGSDRRVWITTAFAHPIGTAAMMPGFGAPHMRAMRRYDRLAMLTAMVHDETRGSVYVDERALDRPKIRYRPSDADRQQLVTGVRACARILLAAGAKRVVVPSVPLIELRSERDLALITEEIARPHAMHLTAVHPMGTMRMGDDKRASVVKSTGEHHQVRGLFVADGSLFPTSIGGPPQITIYALAMHVAPHAIDAARAS